MIEIFTKRRSFDLAMSIRDGIPRVPYFPPIDQDYAYDQENKTVTLFFIRSCGLRYPHASSDPIFPADFEESPGSWTDSSEHACVLGCRELGTVCGPGEACYRTDDLRRAWNSSNISSNTSSSSAATLKLLAYSIASSSIGYRALNVPELLVELVFPISAAPPIAARLCNRPGYEIAARRLYNRDDHRVIIRSKVDLIISNAKTVSETAKLKAKKVTVPSKHVNIDWPRHDFPSSRGELR